MSIFLREGMCGWIRAWMHSDLDAGDKKIPRKSSSQMDFSGEAGSDREDACGTDCIDGAVKAERSIKGVWTKKHMIK